MDNEVSDLEVQEPTQAGYIGTYNHTLVANVQTRLRIYTGSPVPSLLTYSQ